jgi:F0F1-type ATP synthase epsilon subunit
MGSALRLEVLTPAGLLVQEQAASWVQTRLADGATIGIWPQHAPLIAETVDAPLRYFARGEEHTIALLAGLLHIESGSVTLLTPGRIAGSGSA